MRTYRTSDGDMVDDICHRILGSVEFTEAVLRLNPGLSEHGALLPAGLVLTLPDQPAPAARSPIRLWTGRT